MEAVPLKDSATNLETACTTNLEGQLVVDLFVTDDVKYVNNIPAISQRTDLNRKAHSYLNNYVTNVATSSTTLYPQVFSRFEPKAFRIALRVCLVRWTCRTFDAF